MDRSRRLWNVVLVCTREQKGPAAPIEFFVSGAGHSYFANEAPFTFSADDMVIHWIRVGGECVFFDVKASSSFSYDQGLEEFGIEDVDVHAAAAAARRIVVVVSDAADGVNRELEWTEEDTFVSRPVGNGDVQVTCKWSMLPLSLRAW